uniref:Uncharacterized protein n=1 Tax=Siphoviridae sp. ctHGG8 TaxID=2826230 RepID=A0A8S5N740_9CAUD|nr:MAG TPA: hypothetical protein [Siphoviridae sp. ctHGG8]DAK75940.1 MAG TPA: hypothetical protein [Caudoviricetes sp.]
MLEQYAYFVKSRYAIYILIISNWYICVNM